MNTAFQSVVDMGKGLGNSNRYAILQSLMAKEKTVGAIAAELELSQPVVSQHLKVLKSLNLVIDTRNGNEVQYAVHAEHMFDLLVSLSEEIKNCKKCS
tara:strand:- start:157 stop:450 length:294 start_codon:yes stop_codon:yes gene_type:complete